MEGVNRDEPIRVFVVGCPRSGTTLVQSLLAAHDALVSFPETHFFNYCAHDGLVDRLADFRHRELRTEMRAYFERLDRPEWARAFGRWYPFRRKYAHLLVEAFDAVADERSAEGWLEKTPSHLEHIETIESVVPGVKFVHVVRSGADTVASLHAVTHEFPEEWNGARSVDRCIDRWLDSVAITERHLAKPNHTSIQYEELARSPEEGVRKLCSFVGIDFDPDALDRHRRAADRVVDENEPWKEENRQAIRPPSSERFYGRFDSDERTRILERLAATETDRPIQPAEGISDSS